jgi:hypothetical protein
MNMSCIAITKKKLGRNLRRMRETLISACLTRGAIAKVPPLEERGEQRGRHAHSEGHQNGTRYAASHKAVPGCVRGEM